MKTYWDLSETERAALSQEDVLRYVDAELMLKGVLKVKPLALEEEPAMPDEDARVYVVRSKSQYGKSEMGVAFGSIEAANAFIAMKPLRLESAWLGQESVSFVAPGADFEIAEISVYSEALKNSAHADMKRASTIRQANEKLRQEHAAALRAQEEALGGMWEDWTACRAAEAKLRAVADTFEDYRRTADGDSSVASAFLAKVYPADLINEAAQRFGFPAPSAA